MNELTLHPNVYHTGTSKGLIALLERMWVRDHTPGDGTLYIISGFANYNGGVRFYDTFRRHIENGGKIVAILGGSTSSRLSSKQVVAELLEAGVDVSVINRKRLMHAKSYGRSSDDGSMIVVTSGNFTGPGMSQNVELAVLLDQPTIAQMKFSWQDMIDGMLGQRWDYYKPNLNDVASPAWKLLYDEQAAGLKLDDTQEVTLIMSLSHADTARIMADPGTNAGKGSQYFWLSKESFDFLPPLTIVNRRGEKPTYSCIIDMNFIDIGDQREVRVTFEAGNNLDFRLGTGPLRYTKLAKRGDMAAITRVSENKYELRLFRDNSALFAALNPHAVNYVGHQGKQYGYIPNAQFYSIIGAPRAKAKHLS